MARVIQQFGLDTQVESECYSACTIAFILPAANEPSANPDVLDFTSTASILCTKSPLPNQRASKKRILLAFGNGVSPRTLLGRILHKGPNDIWHPTTQELIAAGVISPMGQ